MKTLIRDAAKKPIADPTRASLTVMSKSCGTHGLCTDTQPNRDLAAAATGPGRSRVRRQPCHSSSCSRQHAAAATAPTPLRSNSTRSWPHQQQYGHGRQPSTAQAPQPPAAPLPSILRRERIIGGRGEMPRSSPEADPWGRRVRLGLPRALARPYGRAALTRVRFICGRSAPAAHLRRHAAHRGMTAGRRRLRICCCCALRASCPRIAPPERRGHAPHRRRSRHAHAAAAACCRRRRIGDLSGARLRCDGSGPAWHAPTCARYAAQRGALAAHTRRTPFAARRPTYRGGCLRLPPSGGGGAAAAAEGESAVVVLSAV